MSYLLEFNYLIGVICAAFGFFVSVLLFVVNRENSISKQLLAGVIFCLSLFSLSYGLAVTQFYLKFPHVWRLAAPFSGLMPALLYLYVRSVLYQEFRFRPNDFLLVIPAVLISINFLPLYMLPGDQKRAIILQILADKKLALVEIDGIFPQGLGILIRTVTTVFFTLFAFFQVYQHKRKLIFKGETDGNQHHEIYKWLYFLLTCITFSFLLLILWHFLAISNKLAFSFGISFTLAGLNIIICIYLFFKPRILYGLQGWVEKSSLLTKEAIKDQSLPITLSNPSKASFFTEEMRMGMSTSIKNHFKNNKPFLATGYKIKDLSQELKTPIYLISSFINQEYGKNFNELINEYRVDYITDLLNESPDSQNFTLEALAKSAGFNSRNTFIEAVKKKSGMTPSNYFSKKIS